MTPERINQKIAAWMGWKWYRIPQKPIHGPRFYRCLFLPAVHEIYQSPEWLVRADMTESICNWPFMQKEGGVQNYYGSLDAVHDAVLALDGTETLWEDGQMWSRRCEFMAQLERVVGRDTATDRCNFEAYNATSAQRCEALLRALGLWEGSSPE